MQLTYSSIWINFIGSVFILVVLIIKQGYRISVDKHHDSNTLYRGPFSRDCPESSYPELERHYYKKTLQQPFPESEEEIAQDIERRFLLRKVRIF